MRVPYALAAGLAAAAASFGTLPIAEPASASGTQNVNPPKVCFVNKSGQRLYFKAIYGGVSKGGAKLGNGAKFCSANPVPAAIQISLERKSAVLCRADVQAGVTYTLKGTAKDGNCRWSRSRN